MGLTTKEKGDIAEVESFRYFVKQGYEVSIPIGNKRKYDFIVEKNNKLLRVQVKYAGSYKSKGGRCFVGLRTTGGNQSYYKAQKYDSKDFDLLYVYTEKAEHFLIPWNKITVRNEIAIEHIKYQRYNVT